MHTPSYVPLPGDISKVKTKLAFGLTKRQIICFAAGAAAGIPLYFLTRNALGNSGAMMLMMIIMAPFFLLAMFTRNGKPAETLVKNYLRAHVARAGVRPARKPKESPSPSRFVRFVRYILKEKTTPVTAGDSIPLDKLFRDGISKFGNTYTKTLRFSDVNYHHAAKEAQEALFAAYCEFLNYFDQSVPFQITIVTSKPNPKDYDNLIPPPGKKDRFAHFRKEYAAMLRSQQRKGGSGLLREKYLSFSVTQSSYKKAKPLLERIEADVIGNFKNLGVRVETLDATERMRLWFLCLRPDGREVCDKPFRDTDTAKDIIAPAKGFDFSAKRSLRMGRLYASACIIKMDASELSEEMLAKLVGDDKPMVVSLHIRSVEQAKAIKTVKRTLTDLERMTIDTRQKAFQHGYMPALPPELKSSSAEAEKLLRGIQERNERMFQMTAVVLTIGENEDKLQNATFTAAGFLQGQSLGLTALDWEQEQGLFSALPMGLNLLGESRMLTTSSTAAFIPFTTPEIFMPGGLYYGLNALSRNLIMADRQKLKNPNGLFLGTPGSGKSFTAKREMVNVFLSTDADIIIIDPEGEYHNLVSSLGGEVITLSASSRFHVNPMDIHADYADGDDPLKLKSDFILSMCELILGGKDGLDPLEESIIDRSVRMVYRSYLEDPDPTKMPRLQDLYRVLLEMGNANTIAADLAAALEIYVEGSRNFFNHHTNVDLSNRLVCFDIKSLGEGLKTLGMLVLQDQTWGRVSKNRARRQKTWLYIDEMHLLLKDKQTAAYTVGIWKRFRKWGGIPTGITQNVTDLLTSREIENIFGNSDFVLMLNQAAEDRVVLAQKLGISKRQLSHITQSGEGEGLLCYGSVILPFIDKFPKDTMLYRLLTTKPEEQGTPDNPARGG